MLDATRPHAWVSITLPSHGIFYDDKLPDGRLEIRKMTAHEESILQSQGVDVYARLDTIMRNCVRVPDDRMKPGQFLISDRLALMLAQRIHTFGPLYKFTYPCPSCRHNNRVEVDINKEFDTITPEDVVRKMEEKGVADFKLTEPFEVDLLDAQTKVQCRFLRGDDEIEILRRSKRMQMQGMDATDPSHLIRLATSLVSVSSVGPEWEKLKPVQKEMWVRGLTATDTARIRIAVEERETGLNTNLIHTCRSCGAQNEVPLRFDAEFFLPSRL